MCPHCFGIFNGCTFDTNSRCPSVETVSANAKVIAAGGVGVLSLVALIRPPYLRTFTLATIELLLAIVRRPAPGTEFEVKADTKTSAIITAVKSGVLTLESALIQITDVMDTSITDVQTAKFTAAISALKALKEVNSLSLTATAGQGGALSFLWAKASEVQRDLSKTSVKVVLNDSDDSGHSRSASAKLVRPAEFEAFMEMITLFTMFASAMGFASSLLINDFFLEVVFGGMRRGFSWQLCCEIVTELLRRVDDSLGKITLGTVYNESYLNSVVDLADSYCMQHYGFSRDTFRTRGGTPRERTPKTPANGKGAKFNGKFTASGRPCGAFNVNGDHHVHMLTADGTCKFNHVCDHWVSGKGKNGRCLGEKGTPGHRRDACDNPDKCDSPEQ